MRRYFLRVLERTNIREVPVSFLVQPDRPSGAALAQVFNLRLQGFGDPRRILSAGGDQRRHDIRRAQVGDDAGLVDGSRKLDLGYRQNGPPTPGFQTIEVGPLLAETSGQVRVNDLDQLFGGIHLARPGFALGRQ